MPVYYAVYRYLNVLVDLGSLASSLALGACSLKTRKLLGGLIVGGWKDSDSRNGEMDGGAWWDRYFEG